jgi:hypothetical protein
MKKFLDFTTEYIRQFDWKDLTIIKVCLSAFGITIGLMLPQKHKKPMLIISILVFLGASASILFHFITSFLASNDDSFNE